MKFVLFVEGQTEKSVLSDFIKRWLDSKLEKPVGFKVVQFDGWAELIKELPKKAKMYLQKGDIIAVISIIDLYGPAFYPKDKKLSSERYDWAKKYLEVRVSDPRFRQFFAVHEIEAWLLSNPDIFPPVIKNALPGKIEKPEEVNFNAPPSKLLEKIYREKLKKKYKKITHGKELFDKLDPFIVYQKCPRFREFMDEILKIAIEAKK